jgi:Flp pilus assembly protein TadD
LALNEQHLADARRHLDVCRQVWPLDLEICLLTARTARRSGDFEAALGILAELQRAARIPKPVEFEYSLLRAQRGELHAVGAYLWALVRDGHPESASILEALCEGHLKSQQWPELVACACKLLECEPRHRKALYWRALGEEQSYHLESAADSYARALALDPGDDEVRQRLAVDQLALKRFVEAEENFAEVGSRRPKDLDVLAGLASCYRNLGKTSEALVLVNDVLGENPKEARFLAERGRLELGLGNASEARTWLNRSLELRPFDGETNYNLYVCLQGLGLGEEARRQKEMVERVYAREQRLNELKLEIFRHPQDLKLRCKAGILLLGTGRRDQGLRMLNHVLEENPRCDEARQALSSCLPEKGRGHSESVASEGLLSRYVSTDVSNKFSFEGTE